MRLFHLINKHGVYCAAVKKHCCILSPKASNEDTEAISAWGSHDSRLIIVEVLYRMSKKRLNATFSLCSHELSGWSMRFRYQGLFCIRAEIFVTTTFDISSWIRTFYTSISSYSHLSCSPFLLSNILGHFRHKLLIIFHSRVGASGQSCPVIRDTGPSQRPDTALDMADPAGHGKTVWLLATQQRALYKKHGSAMRNLSLWISSCVHYIRDWFSVGILSTKPLTVWKTPDCVAAAEHSHTDWEGNTARFVQHRAVDLNIWFRATKEKNMVPRFYLYLECDFCLYHDWLLNIFYYIYSGGIKKNISKSLPWALEGSIKTSLPGTKN